MAKITNDVLAEKIDSIHTIIVAVKKDVDENKIDTKENTIFRISAKSTIISISGFFTFIGAIVMIVIDKVWR